MCIDIGVFYLLLLFYFKCTPKNIYIYNSVSWLAVSKFRFNWGFVVGFYLVVDLSFFKNSKLSIFIWWLIHFSPETEANDFVVIWTLMLEKEKPTKSCKEINFIHS